MIRKILLIAIPLLIVGGVLLWWLGGRALIQRAAEQEQARQAALENEQARQELVEENSQNISTTTWAVAAQAIENKDTPLTRLDPETINQNIYTYADLRVVSNTASTRTTYQQEIKKILDAYSLNLTDDEAQAMLQYFDSGDLRALEPITNSYQNLDRTISALIKTGTPLSASVLHLQLINSLASLRQIIYNMSQAAQEPILASESSDLRTEKYYKVYMAIVSMDRYLQEHREF